MVGKLMLLAVGGVFAVGSATAANWYVDVNAAAGGDGSRQNPFTTIQEGVDAAAEGDTVRVGPGVYDQGTVAGPGSSTYAQLSRVAITRRINLIATEGRDKTVIFGGTNNLVNCREETGLVSCVYIHEAARGTVIRGFTLKGGALNQSIYGGGGVTFGDGTSAEASRRIGDDYRVEFCRIEDCSAKYGAGMAGGVAVGTIFNRNWLYASGQGSAAYGTSAYNCLFTDNNHHEFSQTSPTLFNAPVAVNCTFVNNNCAYGFSQDAVASRYYNVVEVENNRTSADAARVIDTGVVEGAYDAANSTGVYNIPAMTSAVTTDPHRNVMMAPILGDYRPVAGGYLDNTGNRASLELIPEEYRHLDFNGAAYDPATDAVPIGILLPAATPVNGKPVQVQAKMLVNGRAMYTTQTILQSDRVPLSVYCHVPDNYASPLFAYFTQSYGKNRFVYPDREGGFWYTLAYDDSEANANWIFVQNANYVFHVDAVNGDDGNDGLSSATAVKSLKTLASKLTASKYHLVHAAPGVYSNEVMTASTGHRVRLAVPEKCHLSLRASSPNGAADTIIEGASDPTAEATFGCGPNAVGGVFARNNTNVGISGFTFRKCRTLLTGTNNENRGAAAYFGNDVNQILDSVFEDNCSYAVCAGVYAGWVTRCLFRDNPYHNSSDCLVYGNSTGYFAGSLSGCIVVDTANRKLIGNYSAAYNTTFYLPDKPHYSVTRGAIDRLYNCVVVGGGKVEEQNEGGMAGCLVGDGVQITATRGFTTGNPMMTDPANGDFRVSATSPALSAGVVSADMPRFGVYSTTDYYNNPLYPVAGGPIPTGASVKVRPPKAYYVDPAGSDSADGLTPQTAKKTLAGAMALGPLPGDEVVAAEGAYDEGEMLHSGYSFINAPFSVPSRVVVPKDVTLRSAGGKAVTSVVGGGETSNLRAVFLESGAKIVGFTITNGNVNVQSETFQTPSDDYVGGAVLGRGSAQSTVEDCDIIGNMSCEAPIALVTIDRCRVMHNHPFMGSNGGVLMRNCGARNSFISHNRGNSTINRYTGDIVNCTIGEDNFNPVGDTPAYSINRFSGSPKIVNTVVYQHHTTARMDIGYVENSVLPGGAFSISEMGPGVVTNTTYSAVQAMFNEDGTPKIAADSLVVDKGGEANAGDVDLAGNQRVMNGKIDIGCYEADWRGKYLEDVGSPRGVAIGGVSPGAEEVDGGVTLYAGDELELEWNVGAHRMKGEHVISAVLAGDAQLEVYANGDKVGTLDATGEFVFLNDFSDGEVRIVCKSTNGEGTAKVVNVAYRRGLKVILR